jgi:hypothetical protein
MRNRKAIIGSVLIAGIAILIVFFFKVIMRPVLQIVDSPTSTYTARLFRLYDEGGPAPYGEEVTLSSAGSPLGRFTGATLWIGYCPNGRISWNSASELELFCPPHPDAKDVFVTPIHDGVAFRVVRR